MKGYARCSICGDLLGVCPGHYESERTRAASRRVGAREILGRAEPATAEAPLSPSRPCDYFKPTAAEAIDEYNALKKRGMAK